MHRIFVWRLARWAATSIVFVGGSAAADPGAFRGPYLNDVTSDAISVLWESPQPTTGTLHYGVNGPNEFVATSAGSGVHGSIRVTGLSALAPPGSLFRYELEVDGNRYPGTFYTAVIGDTPFTFIVNGDNRSSEMQHQAVAAAMIAEMAPVSFVMSTGDMVSSGSNEGHWDDFFRIEAPFLAHTPVYLAIGNHETSLGRWNVGQRIFEHPTTVPPASDSEAFYHLVYGNAQLIVLNTETDNLYTGLLGFLAGDQEDWLEDVLANPPAGVRHRFLLLHEGPYSSKEGRNGNFWLRQWLDQLKDADIDLIVSGHDHYAERGWAENGVPYIIHGGGGAPLYDTLGPRIVSDHTIEYGESRLGYILVELDGPKATVTLKGLGGVIVDQFSWGDAVSPACTVASDCGPAPRYACPGGAWECVKHACRYACDSSAAGLVTCWRDDDCVQLIGSSCPGTPLCEHPSIDPRQFYCRCDVPPECADHADCANRPPPIPGCAGTWQCQDEVCEFTPDTICGGPDAGPADASDSDASVTPPIDAGHLGDGATTPSEAGVRAGDATTATTADAALLTDAGTPSTSGQDASTEADGSPLDAVPAEDSCGCDSAATAERRSTGFGALALVLATCLFSARRERRRR